MRIARSALNRIFTAPSSIKSRLLIAVSVLALSTVLIGCASWYWLSKTNDILEELHSTTLHEVARSHDLTKQSSVFTTSAPFLLSLKSSYLVESEGNKLLNSIDTAIESWQLRQTIPIVSDKSTETIIQTLKTMRRSMVSLIHEVRALSVGDDQTRLYSGRLNELQRILDQAVLTAASSDYLDSTRQAQIALNLLGAASQSTSFLSLGEHQRRFLRFSNDGINGSTSEVVDGALRDMLELAEGHEGIFSTRFSVLQHNLKSRRILNDISVNASELSTLVLKLIQQSEHEISLRREETTGGIRFAKLLVATIGLGSVLMALLSAFYISGYLIRKLNTITTALTSLADGKLEREVLDDHRQDEIGRLQAAFNVFHANASKLSLLNSQLIQKTAVFESTFNNINDGVAITTAEGNLIANNPRFSQLLGKFENDSTVSLGCNLKTCIHELTDKWNAKPIIPGDLAHTELRNKVGHVLEIRTNVLPDGGCVWLLSDTTERRRVEERLQHFQRLESLGQLTGEVAHDVNNILSAIKTTLTSVVSRRTDRASHQLAVEKIEDAVELGTSFTQRLLAFARKQRLEPKIVELNELIAGVSDLIGFSLGDEIELVIIPSATSVFVNIDPLQLESALLNLCMNSSYAITGTGKIVIEVKTEDANGVSIVVHDNGCGMTDEIQKRAVEPFFSTRRGSSGSGLGLSIVYGFVSQSGGTMHIDSNVGIGTTVTVCLCTAEPAVGKKQQTSASATLENMGVLVVEDDLDTSNWAASTLRQAGYAPTQVQTFEDARTKIKQMSQLPILFTDVHLGGVSTGWDLAMLCLDEDRHCSIVVTSGKLSELALPPRKLVGQIQTLEKPYSSADLVNAISQACEVAHSKFE